jgi:uncharacterized LabA/DUF88 family protein
VDRCALFVDAGYVLADGAMAAHGTSQRDAVTWDFAGLLRFFAGLATDRTGLQLLRCYWYEATADGRRTAEHDTLADLPGLKLRLGRMRPGKREGVETEIHRDLTTLARNRAVSDVLLVSAEEDLSQVIADVQDLGVRVIIVHIAVDGNWTVSRSLRQQCDDIVEIQGTQLRPFADLASGADAARYSEQYAAAVYAGRPMSNGHTAGLAAGGHQALSNGPAGAHPSPPAIYTAPVVADYQQPSPSQAPSQREQPEPTPAMDSPLAEQRPRGQHEGSAPGNAGSQENAAANMPQRGHLPQPGQQNQPAQHGQPAQIQQLYVAPPPAAFPEQPTQGQPPGPAQPSAPAAFHDPSSSSGQHGPVPGQQHAPAADIPAAHGQPAAPQGHPGPARRAPHQQAPHQQAPHQQAPHQQAPQAGMPQAPVQPEQRPAPRPPYEPAAGFSDAPGSQFSPAPPEQFNVAPPSLPNRRGAPGQDQQGPRSPDQAAPGQVAPGEAAPAQGPGHRSPAQSAPQPASLQPASPQQPQRDQQTQPPAPGPGYVPQQATYSASSLPGPLAGAGALADTVQAAHAEGFEFGESVARDAPALWLEAVLARKPRMPTDLEARLLQGSTLPIDSLLHDEVRHALRRGFWDALERSRR